MKRSLFMFVWILSVATSGFAVETKNQPKQKTEAVPKVERIGGTFTVVSIKPLKDSGFRVTFVAKEGSPRFKKLILDSPHVHMSLKEGSTVRLSADVVATNADTADVSQVVIFVPTRNGETPVWMLSRRAVDPNPPARLLEMHAPQTDYQVF